MSRQALPRPEHIHFTCSKSERLMAETLAQREERTISDVVRGLIRDAYRQVEPQPTEGAR
jgi:hypothetical protein